MRRSISIATVSALALMVAAGPTLAQEVIRIGASVSGTLDDSDATGPDGEYRYDDYRITARAGQRLEATMQSEAFDTYLAVYDADAGADAQELYGDDDSFGQDTDSRLRFTAPRDGDYLLRARTLFGLEGGDYSLTLSERPAAARAPRPTAIRVGQSRTGELTSGDPETDDGHTYDAYSFRVRTGDRVGIRLSSGAFDPVLLVGQMDGSTFTELAQNDDGPGGDALDSYLVFTAPGNDTYVARVTSWNMNGAGAYTLSLADVPAVAPGEPLAIGASLDGALDETDGRNDAGLTVDGYRFMGRSGQRIEATMRSTAFDAFLELYSIDASSGALTSLSSNDDGGEGTDSRLTYTLPADGEYRLEARGYSGDSVGAYALSLNEIEPEPAPEPLAFGATVEGAIDDEDPRDADGRGYDSYSFGGSAGQRVQLIMRSGDFDTYLEIGAAEGEFSATADDDDGLGQGTDSRLNFTLPESGDYVVRARPYAADSKGLYSIELIDRGPEPVAGSILIGATARGTLTDNDATAEDGSYFDAYAVHVKEGDKLVITMVSNAFDAYLVLGQDQDGGSFEGLTSDDDGLSDTHAKLEWTAPAAGTYVIRAGSYGQGQTGDYAMTVDRQPEHR
ncbi:PPC domain-containing protein [uncultured Brevundimonas sp.]|uniref:PPC domain-containing protein n=1 Tax=uncultured Brevundimonas sp. TaxID=213418 RepID=UPI0030EBDCF4|tara:strand:- start:55144 stop:57003 length:1860 start_codon:yes stop_codon:yes gene_type:complete